MLLLSFSRCVWSGVRKIMKFSGANTLMLSQCCWQCTNLIIFCLLCCFVRRNALVFIPTKTNLLLGFPLKPYLMRNLDFRKGLSLTYSNWFSEQEKNNIKRSAIKIWVKRNEIAPRAKQHKADGDQTFVRTAMQ